MKKEGAMMEEYTGKFPELQRLIDERDRIVFF